MQRKVATLSLLVLLLLLVSLFIEIAPVKAAPNDLYDIFALKEYKQYSSYSPQYTFSKSSSSVLQMMSNDPGLGNAYAFMPIDKSYLHGKKLRISWRWYLDWSGTSYTLSHLYVVNKEYNRKLINSGEFRTQSDIEHPISDYTNTLACSYTATCNGGWISWRTDTSNVLDLSSFSSSIVSIVIKARDPWIADTTGLQVDYLQILDSNNNVLKEYHFTSDVFMERTGTYYDHGLVRKPSFISYGMEDYGNGDDAPGNEKYLSQQVSNYICSVFSATGKYPSGYLTNAWGTLTTNGYANSYTSYSEQVADYSAVFYKGHISFLGKNCGYSGCTISHYGVWSRYGSWTPIKDYEIGAQVDFGRNAKGRFYGTHDFVFIWACDHANSTEPPDSRVGKIYNQYHSSGLLVSWMDLGPNDLYSNGYASPDKTDHVFISFDGISIWYDYEAQLYDRDYAQFACWFYDRLMNGYTVRQALDEASKLVNGQYVPFGSSVLYNGYTVYLLGVPRQGKMHVRGDGDHLVPR